MRWKDTASRTPMSRLRADRKGAVLAEFIIALPVLLMAYFCFLQMAQAYTASLVMRHATTVVARYAAVSYGNQFIAEEDRVTGGGGGANPSWREAAEFALGNTWKGIVSVKGAQVQFNGGNDPAGDLETRIDYEYNCHVPIGRLVVCRNGVINKTIRVASSLNGARYAQ